MNKDKNLFASKNPTILIVFGATGDLARKKLLPALYQLYAKDLLSPAFQVVGFSRQRISHEEYGNLIRASLRNVKGASHRTIERFTKLFFYEQGFFETRESYERLAKRLGRTDNEWRTCANKLFHLAVPPSYYKVILKHLSASHLTDPCSPEEGWTRVIVEKPFGKDAATARELDALLGTLFKEEQIYRIDHYLGKETAQNILAFRFSNSFLEPAWNRESIESISIQLFEKSGVRGRGVFYDGVGALRDVGQNHALQLLALFTMENPGVFDAASIRAKRAELLRKLPVYTEREVMHYAVRGQYAGYRNERGVARRSRTETYFHIKTFLDSPRWAGVPMYLEGGKMLGEERVEISVVFRHATPCLCPPARHRVRSSDAGGPERGTHYRNVLRYQIQPHEKITTSFWVKKPGARMVLEEKDFVFDYRQAYTTDSFVDAYERLYLDVTQGNQTLFVSTEEIIRSWRFIDPITKAWKRAKIPPTAYRARTNDILAKPIGVDSADPIRRELGIIGLGKMGKGIAVRLLEKGWRVVAYDAVGNALRGVVEGGAEGVADARALIQSLSTPRVVWLMVPSGKAVDELLFGRRGIADLLAKGDSVIDGGNAFYADSVRRYRMLSRRSVHFIDVGMSGGPSGARNGSSLMVGGDKKAVERIETLFRDLAVPHGYAYVGRSGAGHFVKMVHNGIEYGMMQALAEGFAALKKSSYALDLKKIADIYNHGSVIESRLVGWLKKGFDEYGEDLARVSGSVAHTGEGAWTVKTAKKLKVPVPAIKSALDFRIASMRRPSYIGKILSALRNQFGGHSISST